MSGHESLGLRSCDSFGACNVEADAVCRENRNECHFPHGTVWIGICSKFGVSNPQVSRKRRFFH